MADDLALLINDARRGDPSAFEALYDRFERSVYGFCRHLLDDPTAAEDACQQTFVDAWQNLPRLRHTGAFTAWLRHGALTACRQHRRRRTRERPATDVLAEDDDLDQVDGGHRPDELLEREETVKRVREAISKLSTAHREVVVMHHLQSWSVEEIAAALGVAEGTVKSRLGRARARLAGLLRDDLEPNHEP